jgi:hypothetical protein
MNSAQVETPAETLNGNGVKSDYRRIAGVVPVAPQRLRLLVNSAGFSGQHHRIPVVNSTNRGSRKDEPHRVANLADLQFSDLAF